MREEGKYQNLESYKTPNINLDKQISDMRMSVLGFFVAFFSAGIGVGGGAILVPALIVSSILPSTLSNLTTTSFLSGRLLPNEAVVILILHYTILLLHQF